MLSVGPSSGGVEAPVGGERGEAEERRGVLRRAALLQRPAAADGRAGVVRRTVRVGGAVVGRRLAEGVGVRERPARRRRPGRARVALRPLRTRIPLGALWSGWSLWPGGPGLAGWPCCADAWCARWSGRAWRSCGSWRTVTSVAAVLTRLAWGSRRSRTARGPGTPGRPGRPRDAGHALDALDDARRGRRLGCDVVLLELTAGGVQAAGQLGDDCVLGFLSLLQATIRGLHRVQGEGDEARGEQQQTDHGPQCDAGKCRPGSAPGWLRHLAPFITP